MSQNISEKNKRIARNTTFLYIRMLFNMVVTLYTSRVVLSMLGEVDFGIYGVVAGFVSMFTFLNISMTNAIQRFFNYEWGKNGQLSIGKVYSHALIIQLILTLFLVIVLESFGLWYINNIMVIPFERLVTANWVFQFSVLSLVLVVMSVPYSAAIMAHERMDFYALVGVIDTCIKLVLAISLKYTDIDKLLFWALLTPITNLFTLICYYFYSRKNLVYLKFKNKIDKILLKNMLSFAGWNLFGSLSGIMKEQGINLVLNYFFGPVVNAARAVSTQVNGAVMGFVGNISIAVRPQLTKSYAEGEVDKTLRYMFAISKINYLSFLLFAIPLSLETKFVLDIWLGTYPEHSDTFIILVFMTCVVNLLNAPISMVVHASGNMRNYQVIGSCFNMLCIPITCMAYYFFKLPPEFSLIAIWGCSLIAQISSLCILKQIVGCFSIKEYSKKVIFPILLVTVLGILLPGLFHVFLEKGLLRFFVVIVVSSISISISTYLIALNAVEKNMVSVMVKKILHL